MARKKTNKTLRQETEKSLSDALYTRKMNEQFYLDYIEQYMSFYDSLFAINELLMSENGRVNKSIRSFIDATAEQRRISNEMRSILEFLGLKPLQDAKEDYGAVPL